MSDTATATVEKNEEQQPAGKQPRQLTEKELAARREVPFMLIPKTLWNWLTKYTFDKPLEGVQWLGRKIDDAGRSPKLRSGFGAVLGLPVGIVLRNTGRAMYHMAKGDYAKTHMVGAIVGAAAGWWTAGTALAGALGFAGFTGGGLIATATSVGIAAAAAAVTFPLVVPAAMAGAVALTGLVTAVTGLVSVGPAIIPNMLVGFLRTKDRLQGIKGVDYDGPKEKKAIDYDSIREIEARKRYDDVRWQIDYLKDEHQKEIFDRLSEKFGKAAAKPADQQDDPAPQPVAQPAAKHGITVTP